jgi:cytochrome b561
MLPPANKGALQTLTKSVHSALYALLAAMVLAGMFLVFVRGDSIFGLFTVPALDPGNKALRHDIAEVHETIAALLLIVAGSHALAALVHHYVLRDDVLRRMWPRAI